MQVAKLLAVATLLIAPASAGAELRGHGGPVRAVAVTPDGQRAVTGSFDNSVILWSLERGAAEAVLRFHDGAVNAVVILPDGGFATAGEDARIAVWGARRDEPERLLAGHTEPIVALSLSPDGRTVGSAAWDGTARLWPLSGEAPRVLSGHDGNVNGIGFLPDGSAVTAGYDATLRIWPASGGAPRIATLPAPQNALAVSARGEIALGGSDGRLRLLRPDGAPAREAEIAPTPVIALAWSPDGSRIAAAGLRGAVSILDAATLQVRHTLVGPGMPVWSIAFLPGGGEILTGGSDRIVRRWNARTGEHIGPVVFGRPSDPLAAYAEDPGAKVFRACVACHALGPEDAPRAGPSLHGLFGRRIASLPGYPYSAALKKLDIVWTPETVKKLFELGPAAYTPGTKMPEQTVGAEDREALVRFLEKATR